jgi:ferredoxin, 2Fe-2S
VLPGCALACAVVAQHRRSIITASKSLHPAPVRVVFVHPDGSRETHAAGAGETVMDCALDHGVNGIRARCGGACHCVTCHCYVDDAWISRVAAATADELEMLDYAWQRRPNSRLSCQLVLRNDCDGIVVHVPERQA